MSPQYEKAAISSVSERIYNHGSFWKMSTTGQKNLKNLFEISSITILLAASSVVIFGQQSFSQLAGVEEEWLVYELDITENGNVIYRVSVPYPATWTQIEGTEPDENPKKLTSLVSRADGNGDYVDVQIWVESLYSPINIEDVHDNLVDSYESMNHEIVESDVDEFTLIGMPAYNLETEYTDPEYGPQIMLEVGTVIDNGLRFFVQSHADSPVHEEYLPIVEQMINSITITSGADLSDTSTENFGSEDGGDGRLLEGIQGLSRQRPGAGGGNAGAGSDLIGGQGSTNDSSSGSLGGIFGPSQGSTNDSSSGSLGGIFGPSQ